ncbi:MAG: hypothetical protein AAGL98_16840, partial [Planctomycetota bacterium]
MKRDFYVGYLALPAATKRWLWVVVPLLTLGTAILIAPMLATQQNDPGPGTWDLAGVTEYTGLVLAEPYPAVLVPADD